MIDFQSSAIAKNAGYQPCHSPSPGGEGRDEGELKHRGRQFALIKCDQGGYPSVVKNPFLPNEPNFHSSLFKPTQTYSRVFEKNIF
jgi:hypothetical protein